MKKILSLLVLVAALSACTVPVVPGPITLRPTQRGVDFDSYLGEGGTELSYLAVDEVDWSLEGNFSNLHPDQIAGFYTIGDLTFALVTQPNAWTALEAVREWEAEGNEPWAGVLVKRPQADWEIFFQASEEGFNPVAFYLQEEQAVLELADDSGSGSGEGALIRYVYPFAGVVDELLYTWQKEMCNGYYIPELYVAATDHCS